MYKLDKNQLISNYFNNTKFMIESEQGNLIETIIY